MEKIGKAIVITTPGHIHTICINTGTISQVIDVETISQFNGCIPSFMMSQINSPEGEISGIIFTKNPKKAPLRISPGSWTKKDNNIPEAISLHKRTFREEKILSIKQIPVAIVGPRYINIKI